MGILALFEQALLTDLVNPNTLYALAIFLYISTEINKKLIRVFFM